MELSTLFSTTLPVIFVSMGGAILCLSLLACCCTAKGKVPLLYIVSLFLPTSMSLKMISLPFQFTIYVCLPLKQVKICREVYLFWPIQGLTSKIADSGSLPIVTLNTLLEFDP
jgi:hypothetical protein